MKAASILALLFFTTAVTTTQAGWPDSPETAKSADEVFSHFEKFKGSNSRLEWARFRREQGEVLVVWEFYWYSSPLWVSVTVCRHDKDGWHRAFETSLTKLSGDISAELRRDTDSIIIRDAGKMIKTIALSSPAGKKPKP
jgi:hypothetical protein